jgi:hypothetical protein
MPNPILLCENGTNRIDKVGVVGMGEAVQDLASYNYTATMRSEYQSPAGDPGECLFKVVTLKVRYTTAATIVMKVYVDGDQTKIYASGATPQTDQTISFSLAAPTSDDVGGITGGEAEKNLEAHIAAVGTHISVEISVVSNTLSVGGVFLPESADIHYIPLSELGMTDAGETQ